MISELGTTLYSLLSGDVTLTNLLHSNTSVYQMMAEDNATLPYVVFSLQHGGDENITSMRRKNLYVYIRGYSNTLANAGAIDAQIDSLIHNQTLTVAGWENIWTVRDTDLSLVEVLPNNDRVYMVGGFYRIRLCKGE